MTDRIHSLLVVLDKDMRDDDISGLVIALEHLRGVAGVKPFVSGAESLMAEVRADNVWRDRLIKLVQTRGE